MLLSDYCGGLLKERSSETVFVVSDGLLAQTLRTAYVRSAHIYLLSLSFIWATACYAVFFPGVVAALVFGKVGVYLVRWRIFCSS